MQLPDVIWGKVIHTKVISDLLTLNDLRLASLLIRSGEADCPELIGSCLSGGQPQQLSDMKWYISQNFSAQFLCYRVASAAFYIWISKMALLILRIRGLTSIGLDFFRKTLLRRDLCRLSWFSMSFPTLPYHIAPCKKISHNLTYMCKSFLLNPDVW